VKEAAKVVAARIEVARHRAALIDVVHELQARLQPATLANEAWAKAKNKGADLAEEAIDTIRTRPVAAGGIAAAIAMFLAREPIRNAASKAFDAMTSRDAAKTSGEALNPPRKARGARRRASEASTDKDKPETE